VLKAVQLQELLDVRHSVFIIRPPDSSKTQVWQIAQVYDSFIAG
jgi:hypothetical protein